MSYNFVFGLLSRAKRIEESCWVISAQVESPVDRFTLLKKLLYTRKFHTCIIRTHYSKSQFFVQKFNFDKSPTFSRVFHKKCFWQFSSWNQSCQQLKSPKPQHFHEFFIHKNLHFSREIKVEFLDKKWRFRTVCNCAPQSALTVYLKVDFH